MLASLAPPPMPRCADRGADPAPAPATVGVSVVGLDRPAADVAALLLVAGGRLPARFATGVPS